MRTWVSLAPLVPGIVTTKLEELISRIRGAGVSCVTTGLLRFQGYGESREMFERSTGMSSEAAMAGGADVLATAKRAIADRGFEDPEEFFGWSEPRDGGRRNVEDVVQAGAYLSGAWTSCHSSLRLRRLLRLGAGSASRARLTPLSTHFGLSHSSSYPSECP